MFPKAKREIRSRRCGPEDCWAERPVTLHRLPPKTRGPAPAQARAPRAFLEYPVRPRPTSPSRCLPAAGHSDEVRRRSAMPGRGQRRPSGPAVPPAGPGPSRLPLALATPALAGFIRPMPILALPTARRRPPLTPRPAPGFKRLASSGSYARLAPRRPLAIRLGGDPPSPLSARACCGKGTG